MFEILVKGEKKSTIGLQPSNLHLNTYGSLPGGQDVIFIYLYQ